MEKLKLAGVVVLIAAVAGLWRFSKASIRQPEPEITDSRMFEEAAERKLLRAAREKIVAACLAVQPGLDYREWFNVTLSEISGTLSPTVAGRSKAWSLLWEARADLEAMGRVARASGESDDRVAPLRKNVFAKTETVRQMLDSGR